MSNPWIVDPAAADAERTIHLEHVDESGTTHKLWIKVKSVLSIGEERRMIKSISSVSQPVRASDAGDDAPGAEAKFEWTDYSFARMGAYIIDWSLAHLPEQAHRLPAKRESYEKLRKEVFAIIDKALDEHEAAVNAAKKAGSGEHKPRAISA